MDGNPGSKEEQKFNTIYVLRYKSIDVVTSISEINNKIDNYYEIEPDEIKVNEIYLANFLNSNIGRKLREYYATGIVIPALSLNSFNDMEFKLLNLNIRMGCLVFII